MEYNVCKISGNSYHVKLIPETLPEQELLSENDNTMSIENFYKHAVKMNFAENGRIASLTPDDNFPYSATIELFSENGSI